MEDSRLQSSIISASVESGKGMASAEKGADSGMAELFKLNQVYYRIPPTLSLVSKRTITRCNFQQTAYSPPLNQQTVSAIFNTGEFQVSGRTSFLVIQAGIDKSSSNLTSIFAPAADSDDEKAQNRNCAHALLGQGGIMNIIDEITFLSASGTEVDRQQNKGLQLAHVKRNTMCQDWYNTSAELQGYPGGTFQDCYDGKGWPGSASANTSTSLAQPWLCPTRCSSNQDYSQPYIASITGRSGSGVASVYANTRWPYGGPTGSVDVSFDPAYHATYNPVPGQAPYFVIPLSDVLGCFSPYMNALIPSQALAGGRIEIRFKNMTEALIATGPSFAGSATNSAEMTTSSTSISNANTFLNEMRIYNAYFLLDSFQMNDSVLKKLNEVAAGSEGLSVMFDTWDWTQTPVSGLSFEAQVSQARSRITRSFCVIRDQLIRSNPFANSLASEAAVSRVNGNYKLYSLQSGSGLQQLMVNSYQAQLGSLYFPQQPLTTLEEYVMNSYYTFSRSYANPEEYSAVTLSEFMGAKGQNLFSGSGASASVIAPITYEETVSVTDAQRPYTTSTPAWSMNWGSATYGFLAERSQLLQLTGLPISNARLLRHRFTVNYAETSGSGRIVDVFTEYTRVMKVFLGGRIVMRE